MKTRIYAAPAVKALNLYLTELSCIFPDHTFWFYPITSTQWLMCRFQSTACQALLGEVHATFTSTDFTLHQMSPRPWLAWKSESKWRHEAWRDARMLGWHSGHWGVHSLFSTLSGYESGQRGLSTDFNPESAEIFVHKLRGQTIFSNLKSS